METDTEKVSENTKERTDFKCLKLENICYSYEEKEVLHNVNWEINAGEKIILTGDNMSGKSTLLKLMAGLLKPDSGNVWIDGKIASLEDIRKCATIFLQNQESYSYFGAEGSGGEVQLENLSLTKRIGSPLLLLDEADASINGRRLKEIYDFLKSDYTVILVTHRNIESVVLEYPDVKFPWKK